MFGSHWRKSAILASIIALSFTALSCQTHEKAASNPSIAPFPTRIAVAKTVKPPTVSTPSNLRQFSYDPFAYIPVNGQLREREVSATVQAAQIRGQGNRTPLLNEVIRLSPEYFPANARVIAVNQRGNNNSYFVINLNRAFANAKFWRGRKRRQTLIAFHALARNIARQHEPKGIPLPVKFVIEGKPVDAIGTFSTKRPLLPEKIMRATQAPK